MLDARFQPLNKIDPRRWAQMSPRQRALITGKAVSECEPVKVEPVDQHKLWFEKVIQAVATAMQQDVDDILHRNTTARAPAMARRTVCLLALLAGYDEQDIAVYLDRSISTVRSMVRHAQRSRTVKEWSDSIWPEVGA